MSKSVRFGVLLMAMTLSMFVFACETEREIHEDDVATVHIDTATVQSEYDADSFDLGSIRLIVTYGDGRSESIPIDETMLSPSDLAKLNEEGTHMVTVVHEGFHLVLTLTMKETSEWTLLYRMGKQAGLIEEDTYEEWLQNIRGEDGVGIDDVRFNEEDELIVELSDGTIVNLGVIHGEDGVGVVEVSLDETGSLVIELSDGTIETFTLELPSVRMSAYETYCHFHPGYTGDELQWLEDLIYQRLPFAPFSHFPFEFEIVEDSHIVITGLKESVTDLHVPSFMGGYHVTHIAAHAFSAATFETAVIDGATCQLHVGIMRGCCDGFDRSFFRCHIRCIRGILHVCSDEGRSHKSEEVCACSGD